MPQCFIIRSLTHNLLYVCLITHCLHITGRWAHIPKNFWAPPPLSRKTGESPPSHDFLVRPPLPYLSFPGMFRTRVSRIFDPNHSPHWLRATLTSYRPVSLSHNGGGCLEYTTRFHSNTYTTACEVLKKRKKNMWTLFSWCINNCTWGFSFFFVCCK